MVPRLVSGNQRTSVLAQSDKSIKECPPSLFRFFIDGRLRQLSFSSPAARTTLQHVTVMKEAVQHGGNGCSIAQQLAPVFDGAIRREQRASSFIPAHHDLE